MKRIARMIDPVLPSVAEAPSHPISLRPYQHAALTAMVAGFHQFRRQLAVLPTGAGKTILFAKLAETFQPGRTLVLAHREELLAQACDKILSATGITAEIEAAGRKASLDAPIVVASVQTLSRLERRNRFAGDHFELVVIDEAHHVLADSYARVLKHFESACAIGVTATPDRGDQRLLSAYFENVAAEVTLVDLIRESWLSPIKVKTVPLQIDLRQVRVTAGDYDAQQIGHALDPHLEAIADVLAEHRERKILVFAPLIACSERLAELARKRGIPAEHIDGTSIDRRATLRRFGKGKTRLVSNAMLLTEGFDEPSIDCIVCLRPTKIRSLFAQIVGRGTRLHPGKDHLLLLDFLWLTQRHNLIRPAHLVSEDDEEADAITESLRDGNEGDLLEASGRVRQDKLDKLARELEWNRQKKAEVFDLLEFAVAIGDVHLAKFEPTMRWHEDAVTPRQRDFLARCGVRADAVKSKGHAAALITRLSERRQMGLATFKQVRLMRKMGIPRPHLISFHRAAEIIDRYCARKAPLWDSLAAGPLGGA